MLLSPGLGWLVAIALIVPVLAPVIAALAGRLLDLPEREAPAQLATARCAAQGSGGCDERDAL